MNSTIKTFFCPNDTYNDMATLFFNSQESAILQLFHQDGECQVLPRCCPGWVSAPVQRTWGDPLQSSGAVQVSVSVTRSALPCRDFQPHHLGPVLHPLFPAGMLDFRHFCPQRPLRAFPAVRSSFWTFSCQHPEKVVW